MKCIKRFAHLCLAALVLVVSLPAAASAQMIAGLDMYPLASEAQVRSFAQPQGGITLLLGDDPLPYDQASGTYFIPQSAQTVAFDGEIRLVEEAGFSYFIAPHSGFDKHSALSTSSGLTVYGVSGERVVSCEVVFSPLPILMIDTARGEMPGDEDEIGHIAVYRAEDGEITLEESPIEINLRGNTSKWLPKKSYRVKITDEEGVKRDMAFGHLRQDDDWILNPMYADTSKIRETLAYELWEQVNSIGQAAHSSRITYAEVFFHGQYWGLYGVQERIDRKQVDANRRAGILYKIFSNEKPTVEQLLACEDAVFCEGIEVKFAGDPLSDVWKPAAAYLSFLEDGAQIGSANMSMRNIIDYGLWAMFVQAHDCHYKNQFLHAAYSGDGSYTMYKIPWDLNHTFGDMWNGEDPDANYTRYYIGRLVMDGAFERLIAGGDEAVFDAVRRRYAELRKDVFTEENVVSRARALHEPIYGAIVRDSRRWPECGMGDGNENNLRDITVSVRDILPRMDRFIEELGREVVQEEAE